MKRKLLSILLTLCLAFSLLPATALAADGDMYVEVNGTQYANFYKAISAAKAGDTVTLLKDINVGGVTISVNKEIIVDLGGNTVTGIAQTTCDITKNATVKNGTIINNYSKEQGRAIRIDRDITVTLDNVKVQTSGNGYGVQLGTTAYREMTVNVIGDNTVISGTVAGIALYNKMVNNKGVAVNDTITLNVEAGEISGSYGIAGNGSENQGNTIVNVKGGTIKTTAEDGAAIYQPQKGELNISGGTITGVQGVQICSGTVSVTGNAKITATGANNSANKTGDGSIPDGAAVSVVKRGYPGGDPSVSISGGTITSADGVGAVQVYQWENNAKVDWNVDAFITGGTFSSDVTGYIPEDYMQSKTGAVEQLGETNATAKVDHAGTASYYKTLADAVAAAQDGDTITLLKDVTESNIVLKKNGTLDLGGYTLNAGATNRWGLRVSNGIDVTIKNGTVKNAYSALSIWGSNDSNDPTKVTVAEDVTFTESAFGIIFTGYSEKNDFTGKTGYAVLNFNGTITTGDEQCPIFVMGNLGDNTASAEQIGENGNQINIGATARITSKEEGIVLNGMAKLSVVDGATITGADAITMKRGYLNITGGTFTGTGDKKVPTDAEHSGAEQSGSAITVSSTYNYSGLIDVKISGGTFKSTNSYGFYAGQSVENGTAIAFTNTTFAISGGNFSGGEAAVYFATGKHITGGYFTSDPSAYVADSYISVTSDKSGYDYMVVEKTNTGSIVVKPAVAEPEVNVSDKISENDKTAVENAAKSVSAPTLGAAAADEAQKIDEDKATALVNSATEVTGETSTKKLYVQTALKVEPTAYDAENKTLALEITPQYRIVASTADKADNIELSGNSKNAQVVQDYQKLTITAPTEISMQLPDGFATAGNKLSIKHIKDNGTVEYYTGKVTADGGKLYLTFTTKGFSPFTISAPAASIGETMYPTLAEAIAKAANGNAVKLEKDCTESVTVSGKSLTIDKNNYVYDFTNVTVDSNSTKTVSGDGKTLTITYTAPSSSSGSSSDPTYSVSTPSKTENGSVTVSPKSASKGDTVTVTVKPDSGYVLETLTVTDKNGNELTLKDKGNGKYTFTMPSGKVEVKATFMEDNSMLNFFYDVPNNAYFYEAVKWAVKNGITDGVGNNLFAPEQPCTRAQIVTFLWRAAGSPEPKGAASGMTDVVSGGYYEKAVAWAIENGITTGTTTSTFSPDATCTRAQAVTFLARALKAKAASTAEFSDVPTDSYFADAVAWAAANGVTEGIGGGLFGSDNDCTRGQIVTFLYRAYNK